MGFKQIVNSITTHLQNVCDINNYTIRYDDDPRATPTSGLWLECNVDIGNSEQKELGINSFRNIGNLVVKIKKESGSGLSDLLAAADIIAIAFRVVNVGDIIFKVPRIVKVGRVEDNYQINVVCPFFIDN